MSTWILPSIPPHDFFLCLDAGDYFDYEHDVESIPDKGFLRPLHVNDKDFYVNIFFNADIENPKFEIRSSTDLSKDEIVLANKQLARILGTDLDLKPLLKQAEDDVLLSKFIIDFYGFKRMSKANLFEDAVNRIIQTQISHKPTAKKMVYGVREAYGTSIPTQDGLLASWPTPHQLMSADPMSMKKHGLSLRKGEYVVGLANDIVSGDIDIDALETARNQEFYDSIMKVRGIGPSSAQNLMIYRSSASCSFPSHKPKAEEMGLRRWILWSYGADPNTTSEEDFLDLISTWRDSEALAIEYLYLNYMVNEKKRSQKK